MLHEKSRRPPKLYIKLEEEKPFAITWLADTCKACKLFAKRVDRDFWLKSHDAMKLKVDGYKLKSEDRYICKSKIGIVVDIDDNQPIYDVYEMGPNVCQDIRTENNCEKQLIVYRNKMIMAENRLNRIKELRKQVQELEYKISVTMLDEARMLTKEIEQLVINKVAGSV